MDAKEIERSMRIFVVHQARRSMPLCVDRLRLVHSTGRRYAESVARGGLTCSQSGFGSSAWKAIDFR